ncbi:MAG: YihY/virulence factor BrkB family protein [Dehalococcoidia bacterium]
MPTGQARAQQARHAGEATVDQAMRTGNQVSVPLSGGMGMAEFVRRTAVSTAKDNVFSFAGNIAFRALFALFPALIALLWLLNVLHADGLVSTLISLIETALPETASGPIKQQLSSVPEEQASGAFTIGAIFSVVAAVWALSTMMRAMMTGLNQIYGVEESRPFWKSTATTIVLALAVSALLVSALFLIVFGSAIAEEIAEATGLGVAFRWAWELVTWPVLFLLIFSACALIYYVAPDVKQRVRWISPGTVGATLLWLLFTLIYSIYVNNFASYDSIYGQLAGIVVLMAYFYTASFILLLGGEMNQVIETSHPTGKDPGDRAPTDQN